MHKLSLRLSQNQTEIRSLKAEITQLKQDVELLKKLVLSKPSEAKKAVDVEPPKSPKERKMAKPKSEQNITNQSKKTVSPTDGSATESTKRNRPKSMMVDKPVGTVESPKKKPVAPSVSTKEKKQTKRSTKKTSQQ